MRHHRKPSAASACKGKQAHATRECALRHLASLWHCYRYKGRVYQCPHCGAWHVGSWHTRRT